MPTDLMIIAGGSKARRPNPFAKKSAPGGPPSPEPIGGRLKGRAALEDAGYHGGDQACSQCQNLKEPDVCRKHMAKVDPDFGHCNDFEGPEAENPEEDALEEGVEEGMEEVA